MKQKRLDQRKQEHLDLVRTTDVRSSAATGLAAYSFRHRALPEMSLSEVDCSSVFFGKKIRLPLLISSMTGGGGKETLRFNTSLARIAAEWHLPMGLGSLRPILTAQFDPKVIETFSVVRKHHPTGWIAGNIGGQQLVGLKTDDLRRLIECVGADALFVHLNPLQELIQPEGDRDFRGILAALAQLEVLKIPVLVKETGCGLSEADFLLLKRHAPFVHLEIGGSGGTHWGWIEGLRAEMAAKKLKGKIHQREKENLELRLELAARFRHWGNPTVESLLQARRVFPKSLLIASGGIRTGQDLAKVLALGANLGGAAWLFAHRLLQGGEKAMQKELDLLETELKMVLLLTGNRKVQDLKPSALVLHPAFGLS